MAVRAYLWRLFVSAGTYPSNSLCSLLARSGRKLRPVLEMMSDTFRYERAGLSVAYGDRPRETVAWRRSLHTPLSALSRLHHREPRPGQGPRAAYPREGRARRSVALPAARGFCGREHTAVLRSVPVQSASGEIKLQFRIEDEIDRKAVRSRPRTKRAQDGRWKAAPERDELRPAQTKHSAVFDRCRPQSGRAMGRPRTGGRAPRADVTVDGSPASHKERGGRGRPPPRSDTLHRVPSGGIAQSPIGKSVGRSAMIGAPALEAG